MSEQKYEDDDIKLWGNSQPICPHCGFEQETTDLNGMFDNFQDEEVVETECDNCEKEFYVKLNMPVRYNTFVSDF